MASDTPGRVTKKQPVKEEMTRKAFKAGNKTVFPQSQRQLPSVECDEE